MNYNSRLDLDRHRIQPGITMPKTCLAIAAATSLVAIVLYGQPATATVAATAFRLEKVIQTPLPAQQTADSFAEFTYPSLSEDGTVVFAAARKGVSDVILPNPNPGDLQTIVVRDYGLGVYKQALNGSPVAVNQQRNYRIKKGLGSFFSEEANTCNYLPPAISGKNVAFTFSCENYSQAPGGARSYPTRTTILSAEIDGQLRDGIATSTVSQYQFQPPPSQPSIAGSSIVFEIQDNIVLYNNGQFTNLGKGAKPQIARDGTVLLSSLSLWRNGVTTTLQTPYGKPSPDGVGQLTQLCGSALYHQSQTVYCLQSDNAKPNMLPYSAIYQGQGDRVFRMIDNSYRLKPENRQLGSFSNIVVSNQAIAFFEYARGTGLQSLFVREGSGAVTKLVSVNGSLDGKLVKTISVGSRYLQGKTVVFAVVFADGSQAIYRARPAE
jgi:hypothetical protein